MGKIFKPIIGEDGTHHGFDVTVAPTQNHAPIERLAKIQDPSGSQAYYQGLLEQRDTAVKPALKPDGMKH